MVAPICASMGFAAVLSATGCDRHLVRLLLAPLSRSPRAVLPGTIGAAYLVNLAIPSQSSTAAALGPIVVPLLVAAGASPAEAGAALVLGASFGGDLLNPGAQDVQALAGLTGLSPARLSARIIPASLAGLVVAAVVFCLGRRPAGPPSHPAEGPPPGRPDPVKAVIPLVPIALLLLAQAGWAPLGWLLRPKPGDDATFAAALPVVRAMLIGAILAAATAWRRAGLVTRQLFEGMGTAYGNVISLTIAAQCFGAGVRVVGLGDALLSWLGGARWTLSLLAIGFPWALAVLSGSGSGPIVAFAETVLAPLRARPGALALGALTCLSAAAGRTMSPVSAVVICGAGIVGADPLSLIRRLLPALLVGAATSAAVVLVRGG
jgi:DcuC family C4-dicarboxylate transporter